MPSSAAHSASALSALNDDLIDALCDLSVSRLQAQADSYAPTTDKPELSPPSEFLTGADLAMAQKAVDAKSKTHEEPAPNFRALLNSLARFPLEHLSHDDAKKLVKAAGATNIDRVHWGSALDAMITSIPGQILRLPVRYLMPVIENELPMSNLMTPDVFSRSEMQGVANTLRQPALGANRAAMRAISKPAHNFGCFGRGVTPCQAEADHTPLIAQFGGALGDLRAVLTTRAAEFEKEKNTAPPNDEVLEALRDHLVAQLEKELLKNAEFLKVMAFDDRLTMQVIMMLATISTQMIARIGVGAALAPLGLLPLAKLVAPIVATLIAPLTKASTNWQDTKSVAREVLRKYRALEEKFGIVPQVELVKLARLAQDHFQSSEQARYWRRLENVCLPTLRKLGIKLSEAQYRVDEFDLLKTARTSDELAKMHEILGHQRELNAVNRSFAPKNYLKNAQAAVDRLIAWANSNGKTISDREFDRLLARNAGDILTVQASTGEKDAARITELLEADAARFGRNHLRNLDSLYGLAEKRLTAAAAPHAPKPIAAYTGAVTTIPSEKYLELNEPLRYLQANLKILKDRQKSTRKISDARSELAEMQERKVTGVMRSFELTMKELRMNAKKAQEAHSLAEQNYWRYADDAKLFQADQIDRIDANGLLVEQLRNNSWGLRVTMSNLFKHDLWQACRARFFSDIAMPFGEVLAFEAVRTSAVEPITASHVFSMSAMLERAKVSERDRKAIDTNGTSVLKGEGSGAGTLSLLRGKRQAALPLSRIDQAREARSRLKGKQKDVADKKAAYDSAIENRKPLQKSIEKAQDTLDRFFRVTKAKGEHLQRFNELSDIKSGLEAEQLASEKLIFDFEASKVDEVNLKVAEAHAFAQLNTLEKHTLAVENGRQGNGKFTAAHLCSMVDQLDALDAADRKTGIDSILKSETDQSDIGPLIEKIASKIGLLRPNDMGISLAALLNRAELAAISDRPSIFEKLFKNCFDHMVEIPLDDRPVVLQQMIEDVRFLLPVQRIKASTSLVGSIGNLAPAVKITLLDDMMWNLGEVADYERNELFESMLLDAGLQDESGQKTLLENLMSKLWRLPEKQRPRALRLINDAARKFGPAFEANSLAMSTTLIAALPESFRKASFDIALSRIESLPVANRARPLDALSEQLATLPSNQQIAAFDKFLSAIRIEKQHSRIITLPRELEKEPTSRFYRLKPETTKVETWTVVEYLAHTDGDSHVANLLASMAGFDKANRDAVFDRSFNMALEANETEKQHAWAGTISQLANLSEGSKLIAYGRIRDYSLTLKGAEKVEFLLVNLPNFPIDKRLEQLLDVARELIALPWQHSIDGAHAMTLQLDFLPEKDLLVAFKKILHVVNLFSTDELSDPETIQMFIDLFTGMTRLSESEVIEARKAWSDFKSHAAIEQSKHELGITTPKYQTKTGMLFGALSLVQTGVGLALSAQVGCLPADATVKTGPYRIFRGKSLHLPAFRFRATLNKHFSGVLANRLVGRKTYAVPNTGYVFTKQCFAGVPESPQPLVKKFPVHTGDRSKDIRYGVKTIDEANIPAKVWRGDSRSPDELLSNGLAPRGTNQSMRDHLSGVTKDSGYISVTREPNDALRFALQPGPDGKMPTTGVRMTIEVPSKGDFSFGHWYDVQASLETAPHHEIAVNGVIPPTKITRIDVIRFRKSDPTQYRIVATFVRRGTPGLAQDIVARLPLAQSLPPIPSVQDVSVASNVRHTRALADNVNVNAGAIEGLTKRHGISSGLV